MHYIDMRLGSHKPKINASTIEKATETSSSIVAGSRSSQTSTSVDDGPACVEAVPSKCSMCRNSDHDNSSRCVEDLA